MVNLSNTLSDKHHYFTTLATIYEITSRVLEAMPEGGKIETTALPDQSTQSLYKQEARRFWEAYTEKITLFSIALQNINEEGDEKRRDDTKRIFIGKTPRKTGSSDSNYKVGNADLPDGSRYYRYDYGAH